MAKIVEQTVIEFEDWELEKFGIKPGDKFSVEVKDNGIVLVPYETIDLDIEQLPLEVLQFLVKESCEQEVSVNEVIERVLKDYVEL